MSLTIMGRPIHFSLKWLKPPPISPDGTMTLFEHLRELRYRLIVSILAILVGMVVAWFFRYDLLDIRSGRTQTTAALKAQNPNANTFLVNINLTRRSAFVEGSALAGAIVTAPFWLYQLWAFVVPGLLAKEKKWMLISHHMATSNLTARAPLGCLGAPSARQCGIGLADGVTSRMGSAGPRPGEGAQQRLGDLLDQRLGAPAILTGQRLDPAHRAGVEHPSAGLRGVVGGVGVPVVTALDGRVQHHIERPRHRMLGLNCIELRSQSAR